MDYSRGLNSGNDGIVPNHSYGLAGDVRPFPLKYTRLQYNPPFFSLSTKKTKKFLL
jgi:hypothetical protein